MKTATVKQLKDELTNYSASELVEICLQLSKFKKENKALLTYVLFEASDEESYITNVKKEIEKEFKLINTKSYFYIKKSVRKILRNSKTFIRYSKKKETEVEILIYFCTELKNLKPTIAKNVTLLNIFNRQIITIRKALASLHEDLQYDYEMELEDLLN